MAQIDWEKLRIFYHVAKDHSFSKAAKSLNTSQSSLSRHIQSMEDRLGSPLLYRNTRGVTLSAQGRVLFEIGQRIFEEISKVEMMLDENRSAPKGTLHILTNEGWGSFWLAPLLAEFQKEYSEIKIELELQKSTESIALGIADVGILCVPTHNPDFICEPFCEYRLRPYASKEYCQQYGEPKTYKDLDKHRLIVLRESGQKKITSQLNWLLTKGASKARKPICIANDFYVILELIKSGAGIGLLEEYCAFNDPYLVPLLKGEEKELVRQKYLIYPVQLKNSKRLQLFRAFIKEKAANYFTATSKVL